MNGSLSDTIGILAATFIAVPLVLLPGYALGRWSGVLGFRGLDPGRRLACAAFLGVALLPLIDSLAVRVAGIAAAAVLSLALAAAGLSPALRGWRDHLSGRTCALGALWLGLVVYALIDFDTGTALRQPISAIDLVKHAALTRAIVETGVPPLDPFFARAEPVSYYYFFYTPCALIHWLGGALLGDRLDNAWIDGRAAFAGLVFWTGVALYGLLDRLLAASGLVRAAPPRLVPGLLLLLMPAAGLDILLILKVRVVRGEWFPIPEWLNEQVAWWPTSLIWVPHHVAGLLAGWLGLLALAEAADRETRDRTSDVKTVAVAGAAFAACAGLSVWVCVGAVATAGAWTAWLAARRHWSGVLRLAAAGLLALALAAPDLRDILANRDGTGRAIAPAVRMFGPVEGFADEPWMSLIRLALLPVNYYLTFGVFAAGALLFWRLVPRTEAHARESGRLLTLAAAAGLLIGGFLRSAILYNDLGWRVVLFAQVAALVWSVAALARLAGEPGRPTRLRMPATVAILLVLGYGTSLYGLVQMRAYPAAGMELFAFVNGRPDIDHALRDAYRWAGTNLPASLVLQQDPRAKRALDFGLYGRQRVAVADRDAQLFGAPAAAVAGRLAQVGPLFAADRSGPEVRRIAAQAGIDALVVSARDPVWAQPGSWVWRARAAYAGPLVRIVRVEDLDG